MTGRRGAARGTARPAFAGALLLLAGGCATPEEQAMQEAVDRARERNGLVGAALFLLVALAVRHVVYATAADRAARRAARGLPPKHPVTYVRRPSPWLVVSAVVTEVVTGFVLVGGGWIVGAVVGPVPYADQGLSALAFALVVVFLLPLAAVLVALALVVQGASARLPHVGRTTLYSLAIPYAGFVALGIHGLVNGDADDRWFGFVPLVLGLVGGFGYVHEARRRARDAAPPAEPPSPWAGGGPARPW